MMPLASDQSAPICRHRNWASVHSSVTPGYAEPIACPLMQSFVATCSTWTHFPASALRVDPRNAFSAPPLWLHSPFLALLLGQLVSFLYGASQQRHHSVAGFLEKGQTATAALHWKAISSSVPQRHCRAISG